MRKDLTHSSEALMKKRPRGTGGVGLEQKRGLEGRGSPHLKLRPLKKSFRNTDSGSRGFKGPAGKKTTGLLRYS